jgi:lipopolysaccharide export LptBFGC system permease protein LptF
MLVFVVPSTNQSFRMEAWQTLTAPGEVPAPPKGEREMSFAELRASALRERVFEAPLLGRGYETERHRRLALGTAGLPLAWLATVLAGTFLTRRLWRRLSVVVIVSTAYMGLLSWGRSVAVHSSLDSALPVWSANVAVVAVAAGIHVIRSRCRRDALTGV